MAADDCIRVEVAYARADVQLLLPLTVPVGTVAVEAVRLSGIAMRFPEIDLEAADLGVWSHPVALDTPLRDGDRVEIYRPLIADPKAVRRQRAADQRPAADKPRPNSPSG